MLLARCAVLLGLVCTLFCVLCRCWSVCVVIEQIPAKFAGARPPRADARSAVDSMRRRPRLACRCSPAPRVDGHARVRAPRPVRRPRPVPTREALAGPHSARARPFLCSRPCGLASASHRLRVPYAAARRPNGAGRAVEGRDTCRSALLDPSRTRFGLVPPHRSRPLFCASRVSPRLNAVAVLTAITWNHDEPPSSHNYHRNSQLFASETYETGRKRRVSYVSDNLLRT